MSSNSQLLLSYRCFVLQLRWTEPDEEGLVKFMVQEKGFRWEHFVLWSFNKAAVDLWQKMYSVRPCSYTQYCVASLRFCGFQFLVKTEYEMEQRSWQKLEKPQLKVAWMVSLRLHQSHQPNERLVTFRSLLNCNCVKRE